MIWYLSLISKVLHKNPDLLSCPWQVLRIVSVIPKRVLPQLNDTASDDILNGRLDVLATSDFVNELVGSQDR